MTTVPVHSNLESTRAFSRFQVAHIASSGLAFLLVIIATSRYGAGMTPDSASYISAARHYAEHGSLIVYTGYPFTSWPPLFPVLLGLLQRITGIDSLAILPPVSALLFSCITWSSLGLLQRHFDLSNNAKRLGPFLLVMSPPLVVVSTMAWSEPLFTALLVGCLRSLYEYQEKHSWSSLAMLIGFTALASMTRLVGVALVIAGAIVILQAGGSFKQRVGRVGLFVLGSIAPLIAWAFRNHSLGMPAAGHRNSSNVSLLKNILLATGTLLEWVPWIVPWLLFFAAIILRNPSKAAQFRSDFRAIRSKLMTSLVVFLGYTGFMIASASIVAHDPINTRLLSPIYVPLLIIILGLGRCAMNTLMTGVHGLAMTWITRVITLFTLIYPLVYAGIHVTTAYRGGNARFYNSVTWRESSLLAHAQTLSDWNDATVYSNFPEAVYLLTEKKTSTMPSRAADPIATVRIVEKLAHTWPPKAGYMLWFNKNDRPGVLAPRDLMPVTTMTLLTELPDGQLYTISKTEN